MGKIELKTDSDVLIIQSFSRVFPEAYEWVSETVRAENIDILVTAGSSMGKDEIAMDSSIISLDHESFDRQALLEEQRNEIVENKYDVVIVLYNDIYSPGYENVEMIARDFSPGEIWGYDYHGRLRRLNYWGTFCVTLRRIQNKYFGTVTRIYGFLLMIFGFFPLLLIRAITARVFKNSN